MPPRGQDAKKVPPPVRLPAKGAQLRSAKSPGRAAPPSSRLGSERPSCCAVGQAATVSSKLSISKVPISGRRPPAAGNSCLPADKPGPTSAVSNPKPKPKASTSLPANRPSLAGAGSSPEEKKPQPTVNPEKRKMQPTASVMRRPQLVEKESSLTNQLSVARMPRIRTPQKFVYRPPDELSPRGRYQQMRAAASKVQSTFRRARLNRLVMDPLRYAANVDLLRCCR